MNEALKISIIVPTFNSENTIRACLESMLVQTTRNFEVVIVDGLSTDRTLAIIESYQKKINLNISSQKDQGIYDAMNIGITKAKGTYLYFLGSDDTLYNSNVLRHFEDQMNKVEAKIIYGNVKMIGENKWVKNGTIYGGAFDLKRLMVHNIPHQALFYHRDVFKKIGNYNLRYRLFADHDFNLRAMANFDFLYVDQIVANFAVGGASTHLQDDHFKADQLQNFAHYYGSKIFNKELSSVRYYIKEAALARRHHISPWLRVYLLMAYTKLKIQSLFN